MSIPRLVVHNNATTLWVDNQPFISLAAEIHNSSASSPTYMEEHVWSEVMQLNINTLVVPIYWELIEPIQSKFDFSSVDYLISAARKHHVKLVLLWYGLWKNGLSSYVPEWVKTDSSTIYAQTDSGEHLFSVSPADQHSVSLDATAFSKLMSHIKQYDAAQSTVIMVQVENEVGLLRSDFDYSIDKESALAEPIPTGLIEGSQKSWSEHFGSEAGEYYMAYLYASAIQQIAKAGKQAYALPFYVNAWLEKPLGTPGTFPTGGPTARMLRTWQLAAPAIDLITPDIYVPNFDQVCDEYSRTQSALLVPETRQDLRTVSNLIYGISNYNLFLFSPFGAEDFFKAQKESDLRVLTQLAIDADAFNYSKTGPVLSSAYGYLQGLIPLLIANRRTKNLHSFLVKQAADRGTRITLGDCTAVIHFSQMEGNIAPSAGFILELSDQEFLLFGINIRVELEAPKNEERKVGLLRMEEGKVVSNQWQTTRILNGDEQYNIQIGESPNLLKLRTYLY